MSDEEQGTSSTEAATRMLTAEYKDGQLEIVEVTPYDKDDKIQNIEGHIISDDSDGHGEVKYMQVLDGKNVVVDLLNLTLVRCEDGQESYRLVGEDGDDTTVTCVLSNDDGDDQDSQDNQESYVVIEGDQGEPVVFLQSALQQAHQSKTEVKEKKQAMTPAEILEKAKAIQKAKALCNPRNSFTSGSSQRGRKRRSTLPPPHELLASPQFKLFLYSCKLCPFKCNAIKELTAHKSAEHSGGAGRWRGAGRAAAITLQCARCPYRGSTHNQLMKHVKEKHVETLSSTKVYLDSDEAATADVLVCGACGFEATEREAFRAHVLSDHAA
ncbi:unnamed protein product, partial [Brenthis ino]